MPPLVWRERIVLCPNCWTKVSIEDSICQTCGEKFQEHPEKREKKRQMLLRIGRDVGNIAAIVTLTLSISLLMITLTLDDLHKWIRPIQQDALPYLALIISGLLIALGLFVRNARSREVWGGQPRSRKLVPYVIMTASGIGLIFLLFAGDVDRILTHEAATFIPMFAVIALIGTALLIASNERPRRKKDGYLG